MVIFLINLKVFIGGCNYFNKSDCDPLKEALRPSGGHDTHALKNTNLLHISNSLN